MRTLGCHREREARGDPEPQAGCLWILTINRILTVISPVPLLCALSRTNVKKAKSFFFLHKRGFLFGYHLDSQPPLPWAKRREGEWESKLWCSKTRPMAWRNNNLNVYSRNLSQVKWFWEPEPTPDLIGGLRAYRKRKNNAADGSNAKRNFNLFFLKPYANPWAVIASAKVWRSRGHKLGCFVDLDDYKDSDCDLACAPAMCIVKDNCAKRQIILFLHKTRGFLFG